MEGGHPTEELLSQENAKQGERTLRNPTEHCRGAQKGQRVTGFEKAVWDRVKSLACQAEDLECYSSGTGDPLKVSEPRSDKTRAKLRK